MPGKIANSLGGSDLAAMLEELHALSAEPTLAQIQACAKKYGVTVSREGATTFRDQTFDAHLKRLASGREKSAQILGAVRDGGAHPLDAAEEMLAGQLLDLLTASDEEAVDIAAVVKIAVNLRASIAQRHHSVRSDRDLARKQSETEKRIEVSAQQMQLRDEQIARLQAEAAERAEKITRARTAVAAAAKKAGLSGDTRRLIEETLAKELAA